MKSLKYVFVLGLALLAGGAQAQNLEKRHRIGLRIGMWSQTTDVRTESLGPTVSTSVDREGFMGGLSYGHWLQENLALTVNIGAMALDVENRVSLTDVTWKTSTVGMLLLGMDYYFPRSAYGASVRPYLSGAMGMYHGDQSETLTGTTVAVTSRAENAFGGRFGGGVDFVLSRRFLTGLAVGYNLMADFDEPIGGSRNYSGPEVSFGISYLFGKGVGMSEAQ